MYTASTILFTILISSSTSASYSVADDAYPSPYTAGMPPCDLDDVSGSQTPVRREVYDDGRIIDISHRYHPDMPSWLSDDGLGQFLRLPASMKNGSRSNVSEMKLVTHTGTHVDAPGHMIDEYFDAGFDVDTLDLHVLNGPALLVDVPRDSNITGRGCGGRGRGRSNSGYRCRGSHSGNQYHGGFSNNPSQSPRPTFFPYPNPQPWSYPNWPL
ncbi:hypothetical protein E3N88_43711 [Mikania micrantha]|uniref:Cyclase family protein n=1 Tax=Mikania micrantha TaxID=192012 RepID=A0A5N6LE56_9ASTR|nr:hypothetical protein E3N88_43711 [Mikania micrantha]